MNRRLVYQGNDGVARILVPDEDFQQHRESEEEALSRLAAGYLPDVAEFIVCKPEHIPTDLTWRKAWRKGDSHEPIKIDFQECVRIHRERLNVAAFRKIAALNLELEIAMERDNLPEQVAIKRTKAILRDMHKMDLSHCKTPLDLKFTVPKELHEFWDFYPPVKEREYVSPSSLPSEQTGSGFIGTFPSR